MDVEQLVKQIAEALASGQADPNQIMQQLQQEMGMTPEQAQQVMEQAAQLAQNQGGAAAAEGEGIGAEEALQRFQQAGIRNPEQLLEIISIVLSCSQEAIDEIPRLLQGGGQGRGQGGQGQGQGQPQEPNI